MPLHWYCRKSLTKILLVGPTVGFFAPIMIAAFFWVQSEPKKVLKGYRDWILGIFRGLFKLVTYFLVRIFQNVLRIFFYCFQCCGWEGHWAGRYSEQVFRRRVSSVPDLEVGRRYFEGGVFNEDDLESVIEVN